MTSQIAVISVMPIAAFASNFFVWALSAGTQNLYPLCGLSLRDHKDHFGGALINHNYKRNILTGASENESVDIFFLEE